MFFTENKRIIRAGFMHFWRSGLVSVSSVLVMVVALFMISATLMITAFMNAALISVQDKVDINVYFTIDAPEDDVLSLKESLELLPQVKSVGYTSAEQALIDFRDRHKDDQSILEALDGVSDNPLGAILNIKAIDPSQYEGIAIFLSQENALSTEGVQIIDKVNYNENKVIIERLAMLIAGVKQVGFVIITLLILVSIFITFNTIRLVIYISRKEINVMKLVGADIKYIRRPFVVQGVIYGILSATIVVGLLYPITHWIQSSTEDVYGGVELFAYYQQNFGEIVFVVFASGIALGAIASFLAVRRYLKLR